MWRGIVGKFVDVPEFKAHVSTLQFTSWRPKFVVVHNTSTPDLALYREWVAHPENHGGWTHEQWGKNLESYYRNMGWLGGPHAFVCPDGILLFTPFTVPGTHSPSWNTKSLGIETVGEFEREPFEGTTQSNLIAVLATLHDKLGLDPLDFVLGVRGLHFHREDVHTTHRTCPGRNMVKAQLIADVERAMNHSDHQDVPIASQTAPTAAMTNGEMTSVTWLQFTLNTLGASPQLIIDGDAGAATKAAVIAFQEKNGLAADGIAGPLTRLKLKSQLST